MGKERKANESLLSYFNRITRDKKELDLDYIEWQELLIGEDKYSSENCRKAYYIIKPLLEKLSGEEQERIINNVDNKKDLEKLIKQLEETKLENEKMKIQFQDQRREYRKYVRESGRFDHMVEEMKESIEKLNEDKPIFSGYRMPVPFEGKYDNEAVLMLSDWHIGSEFDNYFAKYNYSIAKERVKELTNKTIEYCLINNVKTLHLELLGDNIDGIIHISARIEKEEDVISELMTYCEILSEMISELSSHIPYIKVHNIVGNHTRVIADKKESKKSENFERLIPFYLRARLNVLDNVEILESSIDDTIDMYEIKGQTIFCVHGDLDSPQTVVNKLSAMLRVFPDEVHMGHYHKHFESEEYNMETVCNGSLKGCDEYALSKRLNGTPMQKLMIYNDEGKLCTYKIKLK